MSQWSQKLKKLFHLEKQKQCVIKDSHIQQATKQGSKQVIEQGTIQDESFFRSGIDSIFHRSRDEETKGNISKNLFLKSLPQKIYEEVGQINNKPQNKQKENEQVKNHPESEHSTEILQSNPTQILHSSRLSSPSKISQPNTPQQFQQDNQNWGNQPQYMREDDQDSLGYTQNQWDEQTINFELEDRMLDCLEDQKHLTLYRQSLAQSNEIRKKVENRSTKLNRPPSPTDNEFSEIDFLKIVQQQNPNLNNQSQSLHQNKQHKKPSNQQRRNRFSKYRKNKDNTQITEKSWACHFSVEQEQKLNRVYKQKVKQLHSAGSETCEEYISRVFKLRISHNITKNKELQRQQQQQQQNNNKETIRIYQPHSPQLIHQILKKQSTPSDNSFEVKEETVHISIGDIPKIQTHYPDTHNQSKNISNPSDTHNSFKYTSNTSELDKSPTNHQLEIQKINLEDKIEQRQQKQIFINDTNATQQDNQSNEQQFKTLNNKNSLVVDQPQKIFHILSPPHLHPKSPRNQPPQTTLPKSKDSNHNQNESLLNIHSSNQQKASPKSLNKEPNNLKVNLSSQKNTQIPISHTPMKVIEKQKQNSIQKVNLFHSIQQSPGVIKIKGSPDIAFNVVKSPRAQIKFNYLNRQDVSGDKNNNLSLSKSAELPKIGFNPLTVSPKKTEPSTNIRIIYIEPQPQSRLPIFLQRLRRLISAHPNFYSTKTNLQKIRAQFKIILNAMRSAISVVELLYKKLRIQKSRLQEPFIKIEQYNILGQNELETKGQLEDQIWEFFMNSHWQSYKIEEIEYIKPKQKFKKRSLDPVKLDEALRMYNEFVIFYLKESILSTKTPEEIKRYIRIRQKISQIAQYLRMISEDLYTFWLIECHYPFHYYEFVHFLKQDQTKPGKAILIDQIYAKLVSAQECNDPLSSSIIGNKILQKIQKLSN